MNEDDVNEQHDTNYIAIGLALGPGVGLALGASLGVALAIPVGAGIGLIVGIAVTAAKSGVKG